MANSGPECKNPPQDFPTVPTAWTSLLQLHLERTIEVYGSITVQELLCSEQNPAEYVLFLDLDLQPLERTMKFYGSRGIQTVTTK